MHDRPGELEETLDRVQSTLTLQTRALRPREDADARKVTQQVPAGQEPGVRGRGRGFSLLSTRVSAGPGRTPTPAPLPEPLLPASCLSPADAPQSAGRIPAARTAAAMVENHERLRPGSLPTACRDCSSSNGRGPRPETEFPKPGGRAAAQARVRGCLDGK